ncbi:MAG: beta strand repeat-containing protein [Bacteriovoracaceae bacterium]
MNKFFASILFGLSLFILHGCNSTFDLNLSPPQEAVSTTQIVTIEQAISETVGTCSFTAASDPSGSAGFSYKVNFSQAIDPSTFTDGDITNTGTGGGTTLTWSITDCGDNKNFMLTATAITGDGTIVPTIASNTVQDLVGTNNTASTSTDNSVTYDTTAPSVTINQATTQTVGTCSFTAPTDPSNAAGFSYKVTFSEAISAATFTTADITNSGTGGATTLTWSLTNCGDNKNFKLTATAVSGDGTIIPEIAGSAVQDLVGLNNTASTSTDNSITLNSSGIAVTINQATTETVGTCSFTAPSDPTNTTGFSYKVTFGTAINAATFTTADIVNSGTGGGTALTWTLTNCGDDTNFKLTATAITGNGTIIPELAVSTIQDTLGNDNIPSSSTDNTVTYDTTAPTVTVNQATTETVGTCSFTAPSDPTNTTGFSYKVAFSEAISAATFTTADITNSGTGGGTALTWSITNCGDDTNFKLTATAITGNGTIIPSIAINRVQDPAGNNNTASTATDNTITYDTTSPSVTINESILETVGTCNFLGTLDPTNAAGFSYKVTFSEAINAATFLTSDITNSGTGGITLAWSLTNCGDDTNFMLSVVTIVGDGTIIPNLAAAKVQDPAGNDNTIYTATDNTITYDATAPTVTINQATTETVGTCSFTAPSDPTNTTGFSYKVTFSEAISAATFTTADITNSGTGGGTALTWSITNCGDDTNFKLAATAVTGDGTIIPSIAINRVQDPAGSNNTASTSTDNTITYDTTAPSVTINQATTETVGTCSFTAASDPSSSAGFSYRVTFSEAISTATFTTADITNSGTGGATTLTWSLTNCGDDTNFKLTASAVDGNGTIIPSIAGSAVQDPAGNNNSASTATDNSITYTQGGWIQEAYIKAVNNDSGDYFGYTVALSSDTLIVGAYAEASNVTTITNGTTASANNSITEAGAVYVYKRSGVNWTQEAYIKAGNSNASDRFGYAISLSDDTLAVGAYWEDSTLTTITNGTGTSTNNAKVDSGAVYIYKRTGTTWAQEAYIKAGNSGASDFLGSSVSINGNTLAVGAWGEDSNQTTITNGSTSSSNNSTLESGAVYIYKRSGVTWAQEAYIKAPNPEASDYFGNSVSLNGDTLAVGAYQEDSNQTTITNGTTASADNTNTNSGAVYIFKRTGVIWAQEAYVKAANNTAGDQFGYTVNLSGDTLAVGAYFEDSNQTTITNGTSASADDSNADSGAVYIYKRSVTTWAQEAYIKAANNDATDYFGFSVALSGNTLAVGAQREDSNQTTITTGTSASSDNTNADSGAVYVYKRTGTSWAQEAYIKAVNNDSSDYFGTSVALAGDTLAVGSSRESSNQTTITNGTTASSDNSNSRAGAVYIYRNTSRLFDPSNIYLVSKTISSLNLSWTKAGSLATGYKIAYSSGTTAPADCTAGTVVDVGDVATYNLTALSSGTTYSLRICSYDAGASLSQGETATFTTVLNGWYQEAYIKAANAGAGDLFGYSVSLSGDTLAVGSYQEDSNQTTITNGTTASANNTNTDSGAVYVYSRTNEIWAQQAYIKAANNGASDNFGISVSISDDTLAVGAYAESSNETTITNGTSASADNSSNGSGAAYVYKRTGSSDLSPENRTN